MVHDEVFLIFILGTLIIIAFASSLVLFVVQYKRKQQMYLLETENLQEQYKSQLLQSRLEVQEQSFKYFSEEIHDNIGQLLSMVKMQLYNIKNNSCEPDIVRKATQSNEILGKAINDLRNISHTLNSAFVDHAGLATAIQKDLDYICSAKDLQCNLHTTGEEYSLGNEKELLVFRIVQEAMANAIKHATPTAIDISLHYAPSSFKVEVKDNGTGFDVFDAANAGLGLNNMQVRARLLQGEIWVNSKKDAGTTVTLEIKNVSPGTGTTAQA